MNFKSVNELKHLLKEKCMTLQSLIREHADMNLDQSMIEKVDQFTKEVEQWRYRIYLIGEFSCGKSSLLNAFLQKPNLLPRANTAETAVTTEICYGQENLVTYSYIDGTEKTEFGYDEKVAEKIRELGNEQKVKKVLLQLNLPVLQKYDELSFVDMPGLSSTNVAHEESLNRFIQDGGLGLICVSMKDGVVRDSLLRFLRKTSSYRYNCNVVLTKMDESPSAERDSVKKKITSTIEENLGVSVDCAMVSTYDKNFNISEFETMIANLSMEQTEYFWESFSERFLNLVSESAAPIVIALRENYTNENLDEKIEKIEQDISDLPSFFEDLSMDMDRSIPRIVENTLSFARTALNGCEAECIQNAKAGMDIGPEVKSALNMAIQKSLREELDDLTYRIVDRAKEKLENVMEISHEDAFVEVGGWTSEKASGGHPIAGAAIGALSGVAAGAALGSIVPVIGTTIGAVVGGLVGLLGGGIAGSSIDRNSDVESKVEQFLDDSIERARTSVERICRDAVEAIKNNVKENVSYKVQAYKTELETLRNEKHEGVQAFNDKQQKRADIKCSFDQLTIFN